MKALVVLFTLLVASPALAADPDFVLVNATGRSFEAIYLSAYDIKDWDGNLLVKGKALAPQGKVTVRFEKTTGVKTWDLNVVDDEGLSVKFSDVNLVDVETITLRDVDGKITAIVE